MKKEEQKKSREDECIQKVKAFITKTHSNPFSQNLGGHHSIKLQYLKDNLTDVSSAEIYQALLEMNDRKEISYNPIADAELIMIIN